ncbi:MAG TPA: hypothetical protein VF808_10370 [Ktedonobacterales bacterium]
MRRGSAQESPEDAVFRNVGCTQLSEGIFGLAIPVYPSDLTEAEWAVLAPLIPASKP